MCFGSRLAEMSDPKYAHPYPPQGTLFFFPNNCARVSSFRFLAISLYVTHGEIGYRYRTIVVDHQTLFQAFS